VSGLLGNVGDRFGWFLSALREDRVHEMGVCLPLFCPLFQDHYLKR